VSDNNKETLAYYTMEFTAAIRSFFTGLRQSKQLISMLKVFSIN